MINKYTLRFIDNELEQRYQEHLTVTLRKYILLVIVVVSLLWTIMDFLQAFIEKYFSQMSLEIIISQYSSNLIMTVVYILIYYCKPSFIKWALFLSNHVFLYSYWSEDQLYTYWQSNLCTFLIVGTQMVTLISSDCIEMIYQLILFTSVYVIRMILENKPFTYSLIVGAIVAGIGFILIFYYIQKNQIVQYRLGQVNDQWENIFITLIQNQCLVFDYDNYSYSFNYRNQKNFCDDILDTQQLRLFLRSVHPEGQTNALEQYLYQKLIKTQNGVQSINQETLQIKIKKKSIQFINISIFLGIRPIIIVQQIVRDMSNINKIKIEQKQSIKYKVLMQQAKCFIFSSKENKRKSFCKFRRYWIYQSCRQQINLQNLPSMKIKIIKLLKCVKILYPEKSIKISNNQQIKHIKNNVYLLTLLLIEILESVLSQELMFELSLIYNDYILITIKGYFNDNLIHFLRKISRRYSYFIIQISVKLFNIEIELSNMSENEQNAQVDSLQNERNDLQTHQREQENLLNSQNDQNLNQ